MKLTLQTQLMPDRENASKLKAAVERFNEAATWLAGVAFERRLSNKFELQKLCYAELRKRFGLPADMAIRCISQVCEAYKRDKDKRPRFRKHAAVPYSMGKNIGFKGPDRVSISTLKGRVVVPYIMGKYQAERFGWSKGQCDLVLRKDGKMVPAGDGRCSGRNQDPGNRLPWRRFGCDQHRGRRRRRQTQQRADREGSTAMRRPSQDARPGRRRLQAAWQETAEHRQAKCRQEQKEARFRKDVNHQISKKLVAKAKGTGRGIGLENLEGIRDRTQFRKSGNEPAESAVGLSSSCVRSWSTRPVWPVCRSCWSTLATPAGPAPNAGIARKPIARARANSSVAIVGTPRTQTSLVLGTSVPERGPQSIGLWSPKSFG